jgi:ATP-binding cassette subfamily B protein
MRNHNDKQNALWRLWGLLKGKRWPYVTSLLGMVLLTTTERMFVAYILKIWTDAVTGGEVRQMRNSLLIWIVSYVVFIAIGPFILRAWRSTLYRVTASIRQTVFHHAQRLPIGYHTRRHSGDVLSVLTQDVATAEQVYKDHIYTLVECSIQGIAAVVFMLVLDWKLALIIIGSGLASLFLNTFFAKPLRRVGQEVQEQRGLLSQRMSDLIAGFQVIRTFSLLEWITDRFARTNEEVMSRSLKRVKLDAIRAAANGTAGLFGLLSYYVGAYLVLIGQTTFGLIVSLTQLNNQVGYFMSTVGNTISQIQGGLAAVDRILDLLDVEPEPDRYAQGETPETDKDAPLVALRDIHFGYEDDQEVLKGISLDVHEGEVAALVGPSGGGKSTVLKLLLGCFPVRDGEIYVAHRPLNGCDLTQLRGAFAYVPQDAYLFSGSVMENIRYGCPDASDQEVIAAAKAAHVHTFVTDLPSGYETEVGERGAKLSGGQRQRIAIARALLKDAPILLLDEATSSLDSESEQIVQDALEVLMEGRTTIAIAHRLSTVEHADVIYVIDEGQVVEAGSHDALIAGDGLYRTLYDMGFNGVASDPPEEEKEPVLVAG